MYSPVRRCPRCTSNVNQNVQVFNIFNTIKGIQLKIEILIQFHYFYHPVILQILMILYFRVIGPCLTWKNVNQNVQVFLKSNFFNIIKVFNCNLKYLFYTTPCSTQSACIHLGYCILELLDLVWKCLAKCSKF